MNLLILTPDDLSDGVSATIDDHRAKHLLNINQVAIGDTIKVGMLNGAIGSALIETAESNRITLSLTLDKSPPAALAMTLVMALPRPKMLKRTLQTIATMGVKKLVFINSYRVEKSYWQTPLLNPEEIQKQLLIGLEQGIDTIIPEVSVYKRFKPFVEDVLPGWCSNKRALVAHPYTNNHCPNASTQDTLLVIGPEGGFIPYEVEKLEQAGCRAMHIGQRILRVETAVPVLLAKLCL